MLRPARHFSLFAWARTTVYPPLVVTTQNRLFPTYVASHHELQNLLLFKEPLLLHFTVQADPTYNRFTQTLFDTLADRTVYPLDSQRYPVNLANITCDEPDAREMMLTYGVNRLPTLVLLKKQIPVDRFVAGEGDLREWLKLAVPSD